MAWILLGSVYSGWQNNLRVEARYYRGKQNIANNTTDILCETYLQTTNGQWINASFSGGSLASTWSAGVTKQMNVGAPSTTYFSGYSRTVTHGADGRLSVQFGAQLNTNNVLAFNQSVSTWVALPTIPRGTTAAWANPTPTTKDIGSTQRVNLPRASTSFTHDVTYHFGNVNGTAAIRAGANFDWLIPMDLLHQIPNAESGRGSFSTVTVSGGVGIARKDSSFYLRAPDSVVPTVSTVLWDDANPTVKANIGAFVQGLSLVKGSVTGAGVYGSTINLKTVTVAGTTMSEGTPISPQVSGTVTASGSVTDSRGRTTTKAANFTVLPYQPPRLGTNGWAVNRANVSNVITDLGTYLRLDLHALATGLTVGSTQKNSLNIRVFTRPSGGGAWVARNVINPGLTHTGAVQITGGAAYPVSSSFEVKVELRDNTGTAPTILQTVVPTATVTLDMNGVNIGIGKYHERGAVDINGNVYTNGYITTDKTVFGGDFNAGTGGVMGYQVASATIVTAGPQATELDPVGSGKLWFSDTPPEGWLLCQGQEISRTNYSELFAILGTTYGEGDNATTFNLPDLRGRVPVGKSSDAEFNSLGKKFGTKTHTLTIAQMPTHSHPQQVTAATQAGPGVRVDYSRDGSSVAYTQGISTLNTGGGGAHNNIQPSIATQWIIRAR